MDRRNDSGEGALLKHREMSPTVRFALPVMAENLLTMATVQVTHMLIGRISGASLAASGMGNTVITFTNAAFTMINTGTAVLISRLVGAREENEAADTLEQSISLLTLSAVVVALLFLAAARPILGLLMPTAEAALMGEALIYFRIMALSFPFLMLESLLSGALRASGNSRAAMHLGVCMNVLLAIFAAIFIPLCHLGIVGAGLSYLLARVAGAALAAVIVVRFHGRFMIRLKNVLHPRLSAWKRIFRVGAPMSLEQISVQGGYLIANAMTVGLGTLSATVYQVCSSINDLTWSPNGVCSATAQAMVGIRLGEGRVDEAKRVARRVWLAGAIAVTAIGLLMALLGRTAASLYSADDMVLDMARPILWLSVFTAIPGMSINAIDATLRVGGDAKYVMIVSMIGVWLIRLPLTWLLAYHMQLGVIGVFLANGASLTFRMVLGLIRFARGNWIHKSI